MCGGQLFMFNGRRNFFRTTFFIGGAFGNEFVLELCDKTLHRPGTGFAERANRASAGNVVGDLHEVIGVRRAALAVGKAVQRLAHPKRALAAGRALAATFVRVKLADVRQRLHDVHAVVHHDDGAGTAHRAGLDERIKIIRQVEHVHLLLHVLAVHLALELELLAGLQNF